MQIIKKKGNMKKKNLQLTYWTSITYAVLNTCVFTSASEIGALILYFTKLILRIQKNWKAL